MITHRKPWNAARPIVLITAIVSLSIAVPAASQEPPPAPGEFLGAVLISDDALAASQFYKALFGWDMEPAKDGGFAVRHKGRMIAGISPLKESNEEVEESFWLVGLTVEDLDTALGKAKRESARIYENSRRDNDYGHFAVIADRQKAPVMLIEPGFKPLGRTTEPGSWVWAELWTDNVEDAISFYGSVLGVSHETTDRGEETYQLLTSEEKPRAGIVKIPPEFANVEPGWAPYVAVADLGTTLEKVKELGGRVVFGETEHPADASVALIMDPSGAVLFVYQIGSHGEAQ